MRSRILFFLLIFASAGLTHAQELVLRQVVSGVAAPVAITHAGDTRLFITEQRGRVMIFDGTRLLTSPFLEITPLVSCCGERGLLSVAFHPRYKENGLFFVYYTAAGTGDIVIARYRVSADPNRADASSGTIVLTIEHRQFSNHNGGQLAFGPDGFLYAGTGDGGSGGDPQNRAQNLGDLLGKLLRIDIDGGSPYAVPASNPFVARTGARPEIWSYGLRNPWRFSFDRMTGDLWIADVGQNQWEEIDFQMAASAGGQNYGWRRMEGAHCFNPSTNCQLADMVLPLIEYDRSGGCSVTGGSIYRGAQFPRFNGLYFYGDYCTGVIWSARRDASGSAAPRLMLDSNLAISTFGEDAAGEIYVADLSRGLVYQLTDPSPPPFRRRAARSR